MGLKRSTWRASIQSMGHGLTRTMTNCYLGGLRLQALILPSTELVLYLYSGASPKHTGRATSCLEAYDPLVAEIQPPHAAVRVLSPYMYADNNLHAYWRSVLYAALASGNEINPDPPHYLIEWVILQRSSDQRKLHLKLTNELDADDLLMLNTSDTLFRELQDCYASVVLDRIPVYPPTSAGSPLSLGIAHRPQVAHA
ncbi:hypothetical protein EDD16DRAFT_1723206 [Pisolithus croceorrhizus]|nr:hypothetical protein EDD16DRAFT_1723206 [Pisolithus croceorrhizus]